MNKECYEEISNDSDESIIIVKARFGAAAPKIPFPIVSAY